MKSSLVLAILFQASTAFRTSGPSATPPLVRERQSMLLLRQPPAAPRATGQLQTLLSTVAVEHSAVTTTTTPDAAVHNPWDRVCTTVASTTGQLNALRRKVARSGVATAVSYSLVSNVFTSVAVSLAWYGFSAQSGLSPISPGQWKPFLAWYGGFYAVNSLLKPIRFVVALGVVPYTEQLMATFQDQFGDSKKASIACTTTLLVVISSCVMASGIGVASVVSGTPIFPVS